MRKLLVITTLFFLALALQAQHQIFKDLDMGQTASLETYMSASSDLDAKYKDWTLLNKTIVNGQDAYAKQLIEQGADVNLQSHMKSPLVYATKAGNMELVKLLLDKGARLDRSWEGDYSLSQIAMRAGHTDLAKYLQKQMSKS